MVWDSTAFGNGIPHLVREGLVDVQQARGCVLAAFRQEAHHVLRVTLEVLVLQKDAHAAEHTKAS